MSMQPVVLVGMPRSGSTLLTRLLNESPDLFVVNDFYYLQSVDEKNGFDGILTPSQAKTLALDIVERIRARVERADSPPLECALQLTPEQEDSLQSFALQTATQQNQTWDSLLATIMTETAGLLGKAHWGYNTPQDHIHLERLFAAFPSLKVIFLLRDPRDTVRSYKYVTENGYHDPNRYHPAAQSFIWRTAYRRYRQAEADNQKVLLVRYEDVVNNTADTMQRISDFANINIPPIDLSLFGNNSSFKSDKNKDKAESKPSTKTSEKTLYESEISLCEKVAVEEMKALGYSPTQSKIKVSELPYLSFITLRFAWFYATKALRSKDIRKRLFGVLKSSTS